MVPIFFPLIGLDIRYLKRSLFQRGFLEDPLPTHWDTGAQLQPTPKTLTENGPRKRQGFQDAHVVCTSCRQPQTHPRAALT